MRDKIKQILENNGIDLRFCPELLDDLDFAFQTQSPPVVGSTGSRGSGEHANRGGSGGAFNIKNYEQGKHCHYCGQYIHLQSRALDKSMAANLIKLYKKTKEEPDKIYFHTDKDLAIPYSSSGLSKLRHWGLVEQKPSTDPDQKSSGYWRITPKGQGFVELRESVPKKIQVYNRAFYGFTGPAITITEALANKFKYSELMNNH